MRRASICGSLSTPTVHVLAAEGVFRTDGAFVSLPAIPEALLEHGFPRAVVEYLVRQGAISQELRDRMLSWSPF